MFGNDVFNSSQLTEKINDDTEIIFVSDFFSNEVQGGAELTSEALISKSPVTVQKIKSSHINLRLLEEGQDCFWIFGNYTGLDPQLIPTIVANIAYSVIEYDYKFCRYRSLEKHKEMEGKECDCANEMQGKLVSAFMYGAKSLWYMSEKQQEVFESKFPFLSEVSNTVLSSTFSDETFAALKILREENQENKNNKWLVLGSNSWIKGTEDAVQWCHDNDHEYEILSGLTYSECLKKLAAAKGLVFLPRGGDTCPRIVIEAKLLGCELHLNENVQHKDEEWFSTSDTLTTESYLYAARDLFWNGIVDSMKWSPTISGYTTTKDCNQNQYPWKHSVQSMLNFCDEVVVMDGGSSDGTYEELLDWSEKEEKLKVYQTNRNWNDTRFAVYDGANKALARRKCTMDFCWQMDADEVVHEDDYDKIKKLIKKFPGQIDIVSLPVVEYWGSDSKVRMDITPWKWRVSRNMPNITHGIPKELRRADNNEQLYAYPGTDGCDYVDDSTYERVPHASFYTQEIDQARRKALSGDQNMLKEYNEWFERAIETLPTVHHYSWIDIPRKIRTYRDYWSKHWQSLYDISQEDTPENNMFFDKAWSEVTENEIENLGKKLGDEMGGWIFHEKIDFTQEVPSITLKRSQPKIMLSKKDND